MSGIAITMSYNGWMLPDEERARVLAMFPPRFANVKASHVTLSLDDATIPRDAEVEVVGYACDEGVEALVVTVNGETRRPDGSTYHLTLSVAEGRASKESNDVIVKNGYGALDAREGANYASREDLTLRTRAFMSSGGYYITTALSARES
jgi:hypothetical protein